MVIRKVRKKASIEIMMMMMIFMVLFLTMASSEAFSVHRSNSAQRFQKRMNHPIDLELVRRSKSGSAALEDLFHDEEEDDDYEERMKFMTDMSLADDVSYYGGLTAFYVSF